MTFMSEISINVAAMKRARANMAEENRGANKNDYLSYVLMNFWKYLSKRKTF